MADEIHRGDAESEGRSRLRSWALAIGPLTATAIVLGFDLAPGKPEVTAAAAVAVLMAVWWITEAVPLAVTALLPVVLFPALGIMDGKQVSSLYFNDIIFLFIGGFTVALAMQRWNLHRRIALRVLLVCGTEPKRILMGFMGATAFLSMWISNTASTMMMMPIALAITSRLQDDLPEREGRRFTVGVLLAIAYSASIGGLATLVGTPPNLSFTRIYSITFADAPEITFTAWLLFALPVSGVLLVSAWGWFVWRSCPTTDVEIPTDTFRSKLDQLGPMTCAEKSVAVVFGTLVVLWLFRADLELGALEIPGWANLFPHPTYIKDGNVAAALAILLFMLPSCREPGERIMNWEAARNLPWGLVLLFGGGFALASGFKESGLSMWVGENLSRMGDLHPIVLVLLICTVLVLLTELTSNAATAEMLLPIIAALAVTVEVHPLFLMVPATLACSCAFMLPVATPPNAIVFGSRLIRIPDMVRAGLILNVLSILVITLATWLMAGATLDMSPDDFPDWARPK